MTIVREAVSTLGLVVVLAITAPCAAQSEQAEAVDRADLSELAWLAGSWEGEAEGGTMEEHWTEPRGGIMLGLHRAIGPKGSAFFEFLRIAETDDGIVYFASPLGRPPTPFPLVEVSGTRAAFRNPEHDFPQRIVYELDPSGALIARVEGIVDGEPRSSEWRWGRVGPGRDGSANDEARESGAAAG
jgi:hypothetical protein